MRLQIQARTNEKTRCVTTFTLKRGSVTLAKLKNLSKKAFPNIPSYKIKVMGGAPLKLGEMLAMADREDE